MVQFSENPAVFRDEIRAWLEDNCPPQMRDSDGGETAICWGGKTWEFESDAQRDWLERSAAAGLTVPAMSVSLANARAADTVQLAVREGVQMHGGIGMTDAFDMGFYMKRARVSAEWLGDYGYDARIVAQHRGF
jgi:alkylation response protein AidB-like acyl-CoA dehydrogenase